MKKLLLFTALILISASSFAQCLSTIQRSSNMGRHNYRYHDNPLGHWYIAGSFDLNNAFDIDETAMEPKGLDFDIELGVRSRKFDYYLYYGAYDKIEYTNYGAGIDYFLVDIENWNVATGVNIGTVSRLQDATYVAYAIRLKSIYNISRSIGIFAIAQYQNRPDRTINGIFEVSAGVQFYIN